MNKKDCLFSKTHEWVYVDGEYGYIGISSYATMHLGDIVFFDLPKVGDSFKMNQSFGAVESVKSASDLYLPVSGEVVEVNEKLEDQPQLINEDPFANYIIKIKLADKSELDQLLNSDDYEAQLD